MFDSFIGFWFWNCIRGNQPKLIPEKAIVKICLTFAQKWLSHQTGVKSYFGNVGDNKRQPDLSRQVTKLTLPFEEHPCLGLVGRDNFMAKHLELFWNWIPSPVLFDNSDTVLKNCSWPNKDRCNLRWHSYSSWYHQNLPCPM